MTQPRGKVATILLVVLSGLPALGMALAGVAKFFPSTRWQQHFVDWGFPAWFAMVVGAVEATAAVMVFVPRLAFFAASTLSTVMLSAAITLQLHRNTPPRWSPSAPLVYLAAFAVIAAFRWRDRLRFGS